MMGSKGMLNVDDGGVGGLPVVFVHSSAGNTTHWAAQLSYLREHRRAVALDLRGHGKSELPRDGGFTVEDFARDVGTVVEGLGLQRFVLVGHSLGGAVCVAYAGAHPDRVAGLFLLDPASDGRSMPAEQAQGLMSVLATEAWSAVVEEAWGPMLAPSRPEVRERVLSEMRATSQEGVRGGLGALLDFDPVTSLRRYSGPRLSVVTAFNEEPGSYHHLVPELPHAKVEGTGHWVQFDAPDEVNRLLDGFLATVR
ncbi:alpha/beta fold hydrolase [Myxococcus xanthus]|uniref:alpha/beta fold hydrolase n=1 Tax=Myxococcus xanthus TaxID=34 RepID=UPI0011290183|nr:alpha/beta hydrolase [Myxococcus xanthus]QDE84643.1 alpha/beta hydrolase [Myxococcus xanthus]